MTGSSASNAVVRFGGGGKGRVAGARRPLRPSVEALEARQMLAGGLAAASATAGTPPKTPNWYYVRNLDFTLAGGAIPAAQEQRLVARLDRGVSPQRVVRQILSLPVTLQTDVRNQYQDLLGRGPTPSELKAGLSILRRGFDERAVALSVLGSRAFYARAGSTPDGFVNALYRELLGRTPTPTETGAALARLSGGASRRALARALMQSQEGRSQALEPFRAITLQPPRAFDPAEAMTLLVRPGGLRTLKAEVLGSSDYYGLVTTASPPRSPGGDLGINLLANGLPLGKNWDLGTRWSLYTAWSDAGSITALAVGPDGLVWQGISLASGSTVRLYDPQTNQTVALLGFPMPGTVTSIASPSAGTAWFTTSTGNAFQVVNDSGLLSLGDVPTLQSNGINDQLVQFSSAGDGVIYGLGASGVGYNLLTYQAGGTWGPLNGVGYTNLGALSVGSETSQWGLSRPGAYSVVTPLRRGSNGGAFQPDFFFNDKGGVTTISAAADGSAWALAGNGNLYLWTPETSAWHEATAQTPPGPLTAIAATSRYRLTAGTPQAFFPDETGSALYLLTYGIADQPATGFPALTPEQQIACNFISTKLLSGIGNAGNDIRQYYDDAAFSGYWSTWSSTISQTYNAESPPPGVSESVWQAFTTQLGQEVANVAATVNFFPALNNFVQQVKSSSQSLLGQAAGLVGVTMPQQAETGFDVALVSLFQAALEAVTTIDTGAGDIAVAAAASGINSAIEATTGQLNPTSDTVYTTTVAGLEAQLNDFYVGALNANGAYENSILSDYGRFMTLGGAINDGSFTWDYTTYVKLADATTNGFNRYFYQVLMPLQWNIVSFNGNYNLGDGYPIFSAIPSYDVYFLSATWNQINPTLLQSGNFRWLNQIGANTGAYGDGSYPDSGLLTAIYQTGVTQSDLFTGANGWLPVVVSSSPPLT